MTDTPGPTEGALGAAQTLDAARRFLEDLYLFEGRQFVVPAEVAGAPVVAGAPDPAVGQGVVTPDGVAPVGGFPRGGSPAADLEAFRQQICQCTRCPLGYTRNRFVFGAGNPEAGILFVGEAPGADEDRQGEPFVGPAGQLLTRIIRAMRLAREDVYICNVLKCRPPNNRDPLLQEVDACEPYLQQQIAIIRPRVICCLGRVAAQALLKTEEPLWRLRGTLHEYAGIPLVVTYHPAALLRDESLKRDAWRDVKWVRRLCDGLEL